MDNKNGQLQNHIHSKKKIERDKNRWLMVFYDTVLYTLCCLAVFGLHPSVSDAPSITTAWVYSAAGFLLIFGFRFALRCYKQIWRYGIIRAYSRELAAGLFGGAALVLLGIVLSVLLNVLPVPLILLIVLVAIYILISMSLRIFYCYLYHFSKQNDIFAKTVRFFLERLALVDSETRHPDEEADSLPEPEPEPVVPLALPINQIKHIAEQFAIHGHITSITQINKGYINQTYRVQTLSDAGHVHKYTLQRINTNVFPDVEGLMENFKLTTEHLHGNLTLPGYHERGSVQTIRITTTGQTFLQDNSGCWRMMPYFDDVYSLDIPDSPETFYQAGVAFGSFLKKMSDVDASKLHIVIPNFHNTKARYEALEASIAKDPSKRVKRVAKEIAFVRARADKYGLISDALESGKIPTRVCHNDCNLNNILFDNETHLPVAIIDLDTVMPSSPLYDFGDSMRIGTNTAKDDEKDLSKVSCDLNLYEHYARGYLTACGDILTREELELLPYAALIITSEDGIRFLMDYIDGDIYYNIYYPEQNLDRARTQLKLVEDMEQKLPQIKQILRTIYSELGLEAQID